MRVYSQDGQLLGEFGEMRRTPLPYAQIPEPMRLAVLAAEDDRFYEHGGVDVAGLVRAAIQLAASGRIRSGGSTITMQVARNYLLSREQTFLRKFNEILLALQIERQLGKEEILELYLNKIYLGARAYGVAAAAQVYYGRSINELTLAEYAMIAGMPKAPSSITPLVNPERARIRRNWILGRMRQLEYIDEAGYLEARAQPLTAAYHGAQADIDAGYVAEMVRREVLDRYGPRAYVDGFVVHTTLDGRLQEQANRAVRDGLLDYDLRHGLRGWERNVWVNDAATSRQRWLEVLANTDSPGGLQPGFVSEVREQSISVLIGDDETIELDWDDGLSEWRRYITVDRVTTLPETAADVVALGDLVRVYRDGNGWRLAQLPEVQGALVSLDARDGAIRAVVGGFDFYASKFNRATQAKRQPGSSIKPFVYAGALEHGFTPASLINDAPIVFDDRQLEAAWRPENDSGRFYGPTSLRTALVFSRNLVSIRLLKEYGVGNAIDYLGRFGFDRREMPRDLSLALGTHSETPLRMAAAFAAIANGGFRIEPYLIERVENLDGEVLERAEPQVACFPCQEPTDDADAAPVEAANLEMLLGQQPAADELPAPRAERVIEERVAYIIDTMLRDVVRIGTGKKALVLERGDVAGKTGTTNGPTDAWFSGYIGPVVTTAWLGFDDNRVLGRQEYGGSAALPIWIEYMREASRDVPDVQRPRPAGLASVRIDPKTGLQARPEQGDAIFELFRTENLPDEASPEEDYRDPYADTEAVPESIF